MSFRPGSQRTIIWVTDEPYPEDNYSKQQIVNRMLAMGITVHGVGLLSLQTEWFDPIVIPTGGKFYDIFGNFRDILLDISRIETSDLFELTYQSPHQGSEERQVLLQIRYAGLGGEAGFTYAPGGVAQTRTELQCFPNPFNPATRISIANPNKWAGEVLIFNILGQKIRSFPVDSRNERTEWLWNARDVGDIPVSSGYYFVQLRLQDHAGSQVLRQTQKILYLK